jgi:undecaprenyl-diphosphatase
MTTNLNIEIFNWIHSGAGTRPLLDGLAVFFAEGGPFILAILLVALWFVADNQRKMILLEATWTAVLGLVVNQVIGIFYFHPRPYMIGLCDPLFTHGPETSFPSDHATLMFAAAFYLLFTRRSTVFGISLLAIALFTAWGRVYSGIHFPFDMIGSLGVGSMSAWFVRLCVTPLRPLNERFIRIFNQVAGRLFGKSKRPAERL